MRKIKQSIVPVLSAALLATATPVFGDNIMTEAEIREGYRMHAAMTQLHRWFQLYENPDVPIENQLDILATDVTLRSALGEGAGHDVYRERVAQIPTTWQNAHVVNASDITIAEDGAMSMDVQTTYQNVGMLEGGAVRTAELAYTPTLVPSDTVLPLFSLIQIDQISEGTAPAFVDAYPENRVKSLMHYWLALIEDPPRDPAPVREILADDFSLNFSSGAVTDFAGFEAWLAGPASQVVASTHIPSNFSVVVLGDDQYRMTVDFDWQGLLPDGTNLVAKTRHTWVMSDDPANRFAQIVTMDVETLEPFRPVAQ